jgi:hypothetical protein
MAHDGLVPSLGGCGQTLQAVQQRRFEKARTPTEHGQLLKFLDDGREPGRRPSFHAPTKVAQSQCPLWADDRQVSVELYAFSISLYGNAVLASNVADCARLIFSPEGGLDGLPLRVSNRGWFIWSIWFVWLVGPKTQPEKPDRPERPSNQTDEPLRVARAQEARQAIRPIPSFSSPPPSQGAQSDGPSLRASDEHILIVRVLRARRTA